MNAAFLVASRELREHARLFLVAAAVAVIPFIAAAVPGARNARGTAMVASAGVLSFTLAAAIALALGVSTVGRELREKRLSFYFSKPISPAAVWIGKASASLLIVYAVGLIIALPAYLVANERWVATWNQGGRSIAIFVHVALVALFFVAHALSTMVRSRSLLVAVDFVLAVVAGVAVLLIIRPLMLGGVERMLGWMLVALGTALLLILALVPIGQLAYGRTDARRSHAAFSRFFWPAAGVVLALAAGFVLWISSASIEDLDTFHDLRQSANGEWMLVQGNDHARLGFATSFLVNTVTGERERLRLPVWWGAAFSGDGRVLSWLEPTELLPRKGPLEVYVRPLDGTGAKNIATGINVRLGTSYVLSPDGTRLALSDGKQLSVIDIATGRILAATQAISAQLLFFVDRDTVRIAENGNRRSSARIGELDVVNRKFTLTGKVEPPAPMFGASASEDGSLLYLPQDGRIIDGRTGARLAVLPIPAEGAGSRMLNDGTVVMVGQNLLRRFDATGRELQRIPSPMQRANVIGEIGDSKVLLAARDGAQIVDLERGIVEQHLKGAHPAWAWSSDPRVRRYNPGATINYIQRRDGRLQVGKTRG